MSCEACRAADKVNANRVTSFNAVGNAPCICEQFQISMASPGPVLDDEQLFYLVPTPEGRNENGTLNPMFLAQVDREGLSVLRAAGADSEFEQTVIELMPRWRS